METDTPPTGNETNHLRTHLRTLLRKLRDADCHVGRVALSGERRVAIAGCLSRDEPVEQALHYRLRWPDGTEDVLVIRPEGAALGIRLVDAAGRDRGDSLRVVLETAPDGRLLSPELLARIHPEESDPRRVEHFLRRIVRGALRAA